jgi:polyhydroxyalkanoate synthesis regulator protein
MFPFGTTFEEMGKQNLAMFERAMRIFSPFSGTQGDLTDVPGMNIMATPVTESVKPQATTSPFQNPFQQSSKEGPNQSKIDEREQAAEAAFRPSSNVTSMANPPSQPATPSPIATPMFATASPPPVSGEEVQQKIAALQRQLADLAKNKA